MNSQIVGKSVLRIEDELLLRGAGRYIDDIELPGMLHAAFVRSPHSHARIRSISVDVAAQQLGVHGVFLAKDFSPLMTSDRLVVALPSASYRHSADRPVLAAVEVAYVGEPIAIVVADNRYLAEDAAMLVEVEYEILAASIHSVDALSAVAPRVHTHLSDNLLAEFEMAYGNVDEAFASAPHTLREKLKMHRGGSHSIECRGTVGVLDPLSGCLTVWSSTQMPHVAKQHFCDLLGRQDHEVRVIAPDVGGAFGPKLVFYCEDACVAVAAILLKRPVKWIEDRREHFIATTQERDQHWDVEIAFDKDSRILGVRGTIIHDHGAYTARGLNLPYESAQVMSLPYDISAFHLNVKVALTNTVPVTPVRGAGQPQGVFAMERLLDSVACFLDLDRAEVRRRNLVRADQMPFAKPLYTRAGIQVVLDSGDYPACMESVLKKTRWSDFPERQAGLRKAGRHIGIGVANFVKGTGRGPFETVNVQIDRSGRIILRSGATAIGQSTKTMLAQIAAEQLGGDMQNIMVMTGDTALNTLGFGGFNSRQAVLAGSSAHEAAVSVRVKLLEAAAALMDVSIDDLEITGNRVQTKKGNARGLSFAELARAMAGAAGFKLPGDLQPGLEATANTVVNELTYANGTMVAEVEVDVNTGVVKLDRLTMAHDCGRMINPMVVDGQIIGGIAHGIGNSLFERMKFDDTGQPVTTNLSDYLLVTSCEMPAIDLIHFESPTVLNPLGVKGVGECGVLPTPAAIISAIEDALSPFKARFTEMPLAPHDIFASIWKE